MQQVLSSESRLCWGGEDQQKIQKERSLFSLSLEEEEEEEEDVEVTERRRRGEVIEEECEVVFPSFA